MTLLDPAPAADPAAGAATRTVHGVCHHDCPDSCGWTVTVDDQPGQGPVAVKLRGNPEHPYSQGELCPKVNRFLDRVYSPDRILHPLRRTGPKGSSQYEQVTWDAAMADVGARLRAIVAEHGGEAILPYGSAGNQSLLATSGVGPRLFNVLGATRLIAALCGPTVGAGVAMTNGTGLCANPADLEHSRLILIWGTNTKLTNRHLWPTIETARSRGARIVVIDPLRTVTAADADWFLQPKPGTDVALMLALMHVIIRDDLYDAEYVAGHTLGFDELSDHVAECTPQWAATQTGLTEADIEQLARDYATTRPAAIRTLIGAEHHEQGAMLYRTMACLPALTGAWRDLGGGLFRSVGSWQDELVDWGALTRPDLAPATPTRQLNMSRLGEALLDTDPPVRGLVLWNANPMVTVPNVEAIRRGLERDDLFTVVHEQFLTDTARYADYIFPATTQIESVDVNPAWGHLWLGWNEPAIEPQGEAVSNSEFFRRLAAAMELDEPALYEDDETLLRQALPNVDVDALRRDGWVRVPFPESGTPWANGGFPTASGRAEFASATLERMGLPRLPTYVPAIEGPGSELAERYPLQLMTPKHHQRFLNSSYSQLPRHGGAEGGPFLELDPADATARGLGDGDSARVFNDRAALELPVRLSDRVRPGVVSIPWGWWRHQHPDGAAANSLTSDTLSTWGGGVAFYDTLVQVERA